MALSPKHEEFARLVASGKFTQSEAYAQVYDATAMTADNLSRRASRLANTPKVVDRIEVLKVGATAAAVKAAAYTLDAAMVDIDRVLKLAEDKGQTSAAVAAVKLKSQLAGHVLDRKEVSTKDPLADATNAELVKLRAEIDARLAASKQAEEVTGGAPAVPIEAILHQRGAKSERRALN